MTQRPQSPGPHRVFVDSSEFLAAFNPRDEHHQEAKLIWYGLIARRARLYASNFIIAETHNLFLVRVGHNQARAFLRTFALSAMTLIRVTATEEAQARAIVLQFTDKDYSLTDGTSFVIMKRLGISHAFTFDQHFGQYGLQALTRDHFV